LNPLLKILLLVTMIVGLDAVSAQEVAETDQLTLPLVTARIQYLRDAGAQEGSESLLQSYEQVNNWLAEAEVHGANEKAFLQALNDAPAQESEIRERMEITDYRAAEIDPDSVSKLDPSQIQDQLTALRVKLRDTNSAKDDIDNRISAEQSSATNIQVQFETIDKRLQELPAKAVNIEPTLAPSEFEAEQWSALAERTALIALKRSLEDQLNSQPVRYSLYAAQSSELGLKIEALNFVVQTLEAELATRDETPEAETIISLDETAPGYELVQRLLTVNTTLQTLSAEQGSQLENLRERDDLLKQTQQALQTQFDAVRQIVSLAAASSSLGPVLMAHSHQADDFRVHDAEIAVAGDIGDAVIQRARYQEELEKLGNAAEYVSKELSAEYDEQPPDFDEAILEAAKVQVRSQRQLLRELIATETESINVRGSIARGKEQLGLKFDEYKTYLRSRILWVPSHPPISFSSLKAINDAFDALVENLVKLRLNRLSVFSGVLLILVLAALVLSKGMSRRVQDLSQKIGRARDDSISYTFRTLLLTLVRSIAPSMLLIMLAYNLDSPGAAVGAAPYLAEGLLISAKSLFLIVLLRTACEEKGLAEAHFGWLRSTCLKVRQSATWLLLWWWPLGLATGLLFRLEVDSINAVFGRLLFIAALAVVGVTVSRFLWPGVDAAPETRRLRLMGAVASLAMMSFYITSILLGYLYSAEIVYNLMMNSLLMGIGLLFFYFFMQRWLLVARRRLRFQELVNARQSSEDKKDSAEEYEDHDLVTLSESVGQLLQSGTLVLGAVGMALTWFPLFRAMEAMERVTLWTISDTLDGEAILTSITLASLVLAIFIAVTAIYAAHSVPRLLDLVLRSLENVTPGSRYAIVKLVQYVIVVAGIIIFLSTLGLRWDRLQWLVAALGVGIGFGLQEIIANFISGLIILFERPIRRGDLVTVGESSGQVVRIKIRATTIRDFDGKELLVPNKEFVTGRLLNWTLSDNCIRVIIEVGIAYGSDVRKAVAILEELLARHELVLDHPEPDVLFREFGDSSLNLAARCFMSDADQRWFLISDLHMKIDDAFKEAGIVIAFPQIDVHFDTKESKQLEKQK
jgi:potassium efflux system protein